MKTKTEWFTCPPAEINARGEVVVVPPSRMEPQLCASVDGGIDEARMNARAIAVAHGFKPRSFSFNDEHVLLCYVMADESAPKVEPGEKVANKPRRKATPRMK